MVEQQVVSPLICSVREYAYEYVRRRTLSGEFPAGARLNLDEIAQALGVSRMPIREAIRQMASERLVTVYARHGCIVTPLSLADVVDFAKIRELPEGLAIRRALPHLDPLALQHSEALLGQMEAAGSDPGLWLRLHDEFHDYLSSRSQSPRLTIPVRQLRLFLHVHKNGKFPKVEHRELLEAFKSGDVDPAEAAMREHVASTAGGLGEFLRSTLDAPPPESSSASNPSLRAGRQDRKDAR